MSESQRKHLERQAEGDKYLDVMENKALKTLGYFLKPSELFSSLVKRGTSGQEVDTEEGEDEEGTSDNFILEDLGNTAHLAFATCSDFPIFILLSKVFTDMACSHF